MIPTRETPIATNDSNRFTVHPNKLIRRIAQNLQRQEHCQAITTLHGRGADSLINKNS